MRSITLYHVEGRLKSLKFQHWIFSWLSTIQLLFSKKYSHVYALVCEIEESTMSVWVG